MGKNFDRAVKKVLLHEGGFVNDPVDRGGATNWGITKKTYEKWLGRGVSVDEIRNMPKGNAVVIYKDNYWDKVRGDDIEAYSISFALFDQAVNRGHYRAIRQAQLALGMFPVGSMDNETVLRLNNVDTTEFMKKYLEESRKAYRGIVDANPSQSKFLSGWMHRVRSIEKYVKPYLAMEVDRGGSFNWFLWSGVGASVLALAGIFVYDFYTPGGLIASNPRVNLKRIRKRKRNC